jgi:hypothetical protein
MKNVLYNSQVALEKFRHNIEPDLHPVNNNLTPQGRKWLALAGTSLYTIDVEKSMYCKVSGSCFNERKKPYHGCAVVSDSNNYTYFLGGVTGLDANKTYMNEVWRLDSQTLVYERVGKLKFNRAFASVYYDKSRQEILVIGGKNNKERAPVSCEVYSIVKNTSEVKYSLNLPRYNTSVCL